MFRLHFRLRTRGPPFDIRSAVDEYTRRRWTLMKPVALGFRMHSGWGVLVAVSGDADSLTLVDRRRIVVMDPTTHGGKQPYHHAAALSLEKAEQHIAKCGALSEGMAQKAIKQVVAELSERDYRVTSAAVLMAAGRSLPSLSQILASHPLIHTAEGEFFRKSVTSACEGLKIPVTRIRERELEEHAKSAYGKKAAQVSRKIAVMGSAVGPPWTADHKAATLAALLTLESWPPAPLSVSG